MKTRITGFSQEFPLFERLFSLIGIWSLTMNGQEVDIESTISYRISNSTLVEEELQSS
jgi:hypothetical protein